MLFLKGEREVLQTISILSAPYKKKSMSSSQALKQAYTSLLNDVQPEVWHSNKNETEFVEDIEIIKSLAEIFQSESLADDTYYDIQKSDNTRMLKILRRTENAMNSLSDKYEPFSWVFKLVMNSVFNVSSQVASGGTTSAAVGSLFIDPRGNYTEVDLYELLVHELGHTLLFLYGWRFGLFNDQERIPNIKTFALSAIRNQQRPYDKVLHSVLVSLEVLKLRETVIGHHQKTVLHPPSEKLISAVKKSIHSLYEVDEREDMLNEFGKSLLSDFDRAIHKIKIKEEYF